MIRYYIWSSNNICCAKSGIVAITSLKKNYFIKSVCLKLYFDIHGNKMIEKCILIFVTSLLDFISGIRGFMEKRNFFWKKAGKNPS
jgi:hypothetical protein